jgi:hypothetical protein
MPQMTMVKALNQAMAEAMREDRRVMVLGQDVGQDEGVFRVTAGLMKEFGPKTAASTPPWPKPPSSAPPSAWAFTDFLPICRAAVRRLQRSRPSTRPRTTSAASAIAPAASYHGAAGHPHALRRRHPRDRAPQRGARGDLRAPGRPEGRDPLRAAQRAGVAAGRDLRSRSGHLLRAEGAVIARSARKCPTSRRPCPSARASSPAKART